MFSDLSHIILRSKGFSEQSVSTIVNVIEI